MITSSEVFISVAQKKNKNIYGVVHGFHGAMLTLVPVNSIIGLHKTNNHWLPP